MAEGAQWRGDEADEPWAGNGDQLDDTALSGEVNDLYQRGVQLLDSGNAAAATQLLVRAADRVPHSRPVLEALARAQFDAEQYREAADAFRTLADSNPEDDYAQFGWGLAAARLGDYELAVEHLARAAAMRPDVRYYTQALRGARATVRSHSAAGKHGHS